MSILKDLLTENQYNQENRTEIFAAADAILSGMVESGDFGLSEATTTPQGGFDLSFTQDARDQEELEDLRRYILEAFYNDFHTWKQNEFSGRNETGE